LDRKILCCGGRGDILCKGRCLAATLAFIHPLPGAMTPCSIVTDKNVSRYCQMFPGEVEAKLSPIKNHTMVTSLKIFIFR